MEEMYLGDGVYASFDGYYIWLDLRAVYPTIRIALRPQVVGMLDLYRKKINKMVQAEMGGVEDSDD